MAGGGRALKEKDGLISMMFGGVVTCLVVES